MPWVKARKTYICHRCKERIRKGEVYHYRSPRKGAKDKKGPPSAHRTYRYHMECRSLSGRRESGLTKNFQTFIRTVGEGPKMTEEIPISPELVNQCYRKAVMMTIPIYKHVFYTHRHKAVMYFMREHEQECLQRVKKLGKPTHTFPKQHGSILGPKRS